MPIRLNQIESKICQILLQAASNLNPPLTLRIAGGWVRDKLLGLESKDMDIAIDVMKGEAFAHHLKAFIEEKNIHQMGHIATIQVNPDKSKHLETATFKLFGESVDFVHLRTETYNADSRNPIVTFGTPLEDALRRDITINALFYNINTEQVEDFTGQGLSDLSLGIIRTPMPAEQTFIDDPLRILRVIRFATRFNYTLQEDIIVAAKKQEIQESFEKKISRERVGIEIDKMMQGPEPCRALQLIVDFGFYDLVFAHTSLTSPDDENTRIDSCIALKSIQIVNTLELLDSVKDKRRALHLACAVLPFKGLKSFVKQNKTIPASKHVILTSLKLSVHDANTISGLMEFAGQIHSKIKENTIQPLSRKELGMFIREIAKESSLLADWKLSFYFSLVIDLSTLPESHHKQIIHEYMDMFERIQALDLEQVHDLKSIIDGKTVAKCLDVRPGPYIGRILNRVMEWQLQHPQEDANTCLEWLEKNKQDLI